jgi:hypothetical protein
MIDLIRDMAARRRLWGAERIRGELGKLGTKVSKRTIQKDIHDNPGQRSPASDDDLGRPNAPPPTDSLLRPERE